MRIRVDVSGADEALRDLKRLGTAGQLAAKAVFARFTQRVVAKAKPLTPVDPIDGGTLRASVRTSRPNVTKTGLVSAGVVAGGAPLKLKLERTHHKANVYAVAQHEDLALHHSEGGPKYLERPFIAEVVNVPDELLDEMDKVARG